ncbi:MAG TPA: VOC family protein [Roseiflexaceae bacterium]|nr:VOC family protein [Roseiflexaceae bacterium]
MSEPTLGTTTVMQVGLIVRDIEAKARVWSKILGLPMPKIMVTDTYERAQTEYQGQRSEARARLAFFHLGQVDLELIEPIGEPNTWKDQLDAYGDSLHHIAFFIKGMPEKTTYLSAEGLPLIQRGEYPGGRYAYFDSVAQLGRF